MFNIFIKNYMNAAGTEISSEATMFTIPLSSVCPITSGSVKSSEDNADSFDFVMEANSPYYNSLKQMKTKIRVVYDGQVIFNGRVLTVSGTSVYQTRHVHCEGFYGYTNDSYYFGKKENRRSKITWSEYLDRIINNHNSYVESAKDLVRGTVTTNGNSSWTPTTEEKKYEPDSITSTMSLLNSLKGEFGGHFRVRTTGGLTAGASCTNYLDWYKYFSRDLGSGSRPKVKVKVNIADLNSESGVDNLFTRLIPTGKANNSGEPLYVKGYTYTDKNGNTHTHDKKYVSVGIANNLYTDEQLNDAFHSADDYRNAESNYGSIYKPENFEGAKTKKELWDAMKKWIKNCYFGLNTSFTVRAIDLHFLDNTKPQILIGDRVDVQYYLYINGVPTLQSKTLACKAVTYDLFNPDNNSYTFGVPSEILKSTYSASKSGRGDDTDKPNGGGGGPGGDYPITFDGIRLTIKEDTSATWGGIDNAQDFVDGSELSGTGMGYYPPEIEGYTGDPNNHKDQWFGIRIVGQLKLRQAFVFVSDHGIGVIRPGSRFYAAGTAAEVVYWYTRKGSIGGYVPKDPVVTVTDRAGKITNIIFQKAQEGVDKVKKFIFDTWNGKFFKLSSEDTTQGTEQDIVSIGEANNGGGEVKVNDNDGNQTVTVEGNDGVVEVTNPTTGRPAVSMSGKDKFIKMEKDSQGKWKLQLNVPITYKDAQGNTQTTNHAITAADFQVPSIPSFKTKLAVIDQLVAGEATIGNLEAAFARIRLLEADSITTNNLKLSIANLDELNAAGITTAYLKSTSYVECDTVSADNFVLGSASLKGAVDRVEVQDNHNGTYTLRYRDFEGHWTDAETFSKAGGIESVSWSWPAGAAQATVMLQGDSTPHRYRSPAIDHLTVDGDPIFNNDKKKCMVDFFLYDDAGHHITDLTSPWIDTTESWDDGHAKGMASSGTATGRPGSSYNWTFSIVSVDGVAKNITIDASDIYSDARLGYTLGTFTQVNVTPIDDSNGIRLGSQGQYYAASGQFIVQGAAHRVTPINTDTEIRVYSPKKFYKKGSTFTVQGSTFKKLKRYNSSENIGVSLYKKNTDGTYSVAGSGIWYLVDTSGTQYYMAGTTTKTAIGDEVSAREVAPSGGGYLYYKAGTALNLYDAGTQTKTAIGNGVIARPVVTSGGSMFYPAGETQQLYRKT